MVTVKPANSDPTPDSTTAVSDDDFTHYAHLANGEVVKVKHAEGVFNNLWNDGKGFLHTVIGLYPREVKAPTNE